jgi:mRNA interferase MazF
MNDIKRGEMFYISRGGASYNGSEQHADRPAVVVSNNKNNENSNVVEVVYMTTQPKTDLPTHVTIRSTGRISTVLCEQVYSVSTERIGTYIGEATDKEMENIDIALMISLQLDNGIKTAKEYYKTIKEQQEEIDSLKREIEMLQQEHEDTIAEIEQDAAVYVEENKKIANIASSEETIRLQTERDTYKTMYEQLQGKEKGWNPQDDSKRQSKRNSKQRLMLQKRLMRNRQQRPERTPNSQRHSKRNLTS